jgi:hypothetical protein
MVFHADLGWACLIFNFSQCTLALSTQSSIMTGTCFSVSECIASGGTSSGNCASGSQILCQGQILPSICALVHIKNNHNLSSLVLIRNCNISLVNRKPFFRSFFEEGFFCFNFLSFLHSDASFSKSWGKKF